MERVRVRLACLSVPLAAAVSNATTIDFELGGPDLFVNTNPLSNEYAGVGALFSGPSATDGGAVIDVVGGGWSVDPFSGADALGFNDAATLMNGGRPIGPERIDFSATASQVSLFFASATGSANGTIEAFNSGGTSLGSMTMSSDAEWVELSVSAAGIAYVRVSSTASAWLVDDLTFTPVPEPSTLLVSGAGLLLLLSRKRR